MHFLFNIAGVIIIFATYRLIKRIRFIRTGTIAEATVVNRTIVKATSSDDYDSLIITFKFPDEEATYEEKFSQMSHWHIGDQATVVYKKQNSKYNGLYKVIFLHFRGVFGGVTALYCMAFVLIIIAAGEYWAEAFFNSLG